MAKRPNEIAPPPWTLSSSFGSQASTPLKRLKTTVDDSAASNDVKPSLSSDSSSDSESDSGSEAGPDNTSVPKVEEGTPTGTQTVKRDPDYYFHDGSVVVRVGNLLFKIHASLFKARSESFRELFDMPLVADEEPTEGASDAYPIVISEVEPSQFRSLVKMFYSPPSDELVIGLYDSDEKSERAWINFQFLLDVARLSNRFGIVDMETWATNRLKPLAHSKTELIADQLKKSETPSCASFLDAIRHAKAVYAPRLVHEARYLAQYYCYSPNDIIPLEELVSLFRTPDLREVDEALFGYLFVLLLRDGHQTWQNEIFTLKDRMAFFSAQAYLTPLPDMLFDEMTFSFLKPDLKPAFSKRISTSTTPQTCIEKCHGIAFQAWTEEFDDAFYQSITSRQALLAVETLASLPWRRLKFGHKLRAQQCAQRCYTTALPRLDRDLERLYIRLAGYYKEIK